MPIQTVGVTEALLQLIATHRDSEGRRGIVLGDLWTEIVSFLDKSDDPIFVLYRTLGIDPTKPGAQFLGDLTELIRSGFIVLQDGRLKTTAIGQFLASARELPPNLRSLGDRVAGAEPISRHFKKVCISCGEIIEQCRCGDPNKQVLHGICTDCDKRVEEGASLNPAMDMDKVKDSIKRLGDFLQNPQPKLFGWNVITRDLMAELRDQLNLALEPPTRRTRQQRKEWSRDICGND